MLHNHDIIAKNLIKANYPGINRINLIKDNDALTSRTKDSIALIDSKTYNSTRSNRVNRRKSIATRSSIKRKKHATIITVVNLAT
jgi:hypothetical protein